MPRSILRGAPWPAPGEPLFTREDTDLAIALEEQERAEAADRCPLCGLPIAVCRDPDNQFRFKTSAERCHATYAIATAQAKNRDDDESAGRATAWSAHLKATSART